MSERAKTESSDRRAVLGALGLLCLAAFVQRRLGLGNWSYWLDEAMELSFVSKSAGDALRAIVFDAAHPPLEYVITFLTVRLGHGSESLIRLAPALWSTLAGVCLFFAAGGVRRPARALGAALFFLATPLSVQMGQEVRPYALALLLLAATTALVEAEAPLWLTALASVLCCQTLYLTFFPLAVLWGALLLRGRQNARALPALLVPAASLAGLGFWLLFVGRRTVQATHVGLGPNLSRRALAALATGLFSGREEQLTFLWGAAIPALLVLAGGLLSVRRSPLPAVMFLAATLGPPALLVASHHWINVRYLAFALVPASLLAGVAIEAAARRSRIAAVALAASMVFAHLPSYRDMALYARPDWRSVSEYLAFRGGAETPVLMPDDWAWISLRAQPGMDRRLIRISDASAIDGISDGWVVASAHLPSWASARLDATRPWAAFPDADGARVWRVRNGKLVPP